MLETKPILNSLALDGYLKLYYTHFINSKLKTWNS